ncbi:MAG: type II toxin-antitoxin system VapC family toxin [Chloroflexota bacterium]|nr:type II toxin-antitoxin system VapC family toxin [Chloroflexota bacterium]
MAKYLLDTTALIDYLNGRQGVIELLRGFVMQGHNLGICCINITELYSGLREAERSLAARLLDTLDYHEVTPDVAKQAGSYRSDFARKGITLSTSDCIIAAVAVANGAILITANVKDYPMVELQKLAH